MMNVLPQLALLVSVLIYAHLIILATAVRKVQANASRALARLTDLTTERYVGNEAEFDDLRTTIRDVGGCAPGIVFRPQLHVLARVLRGRSPHVNHDWSGTSGGDEGVIWQHDLDVLDVAGSTVRDFFYLWALGSLFDIRMWRRFYSVCEVRKGIKNDIASGKRFEDLSDSEKTNASSAVTDLVSLKGILT